jgi:hypothetical protein
MKSLNRLTIGFFINKFPMKFVKFLYIALTLRGPMSSDARQCVPLEKIQRRAWLDTLYCYDSCRFQMADLS